VADRRRALLFRCGCTHRTAQCKARPGAAAVQRRNGIYRQQYHAVGAEAFCRRQGQAGRLHRQGPLAGGCRSCREGGRRLPPATNTGSAGRDRVDGPEYGARAGECRRFLLCTVTLQSRDAGFAPARLGLQAVRLRRRPGHRLHAGDAGHGRALFDAGRRGPSVETEELRRQIRRSFHSAHRT
jgi:hypothetical protein